MIRTRFVSIVILLSLAGTVTSAAAQDAEEEPSLPTASPTAAATDPTPGGSITGAVRFTDGRPSPRRTVQIESADGTYRNSATTDADGVYVFKGLADGRYYVGGFHPSRIPPEAVASGEIVANPNTTQESVQALGATPLVRIVDIVDGATITGIDFTITDIGPEIVEGPEVDGR
ncbi:MAG TPA: carboxypeptidase-like regulatory domain-containing protein, partial [Dehalococcoidia bacterium]|nr:carboxypeptidase-like regulatory domain-containing protein [Dehalococcoidia bacterium]